MKCNLDCVYCETGIYGGHDNSTQHPQLDQCLQSIDFMYEYVDLYMSRRISSLKTVVLNVYGGEALHHPDIVHILETCRQKYLAYQSKWTLAITTTTNAVISSQKLAQILPLIDEFTVSYHAGASDKQKHQVRQNLLDIQASGARCNCVVMMAPQYFDDAVAHVAWCEKNNIKHLAKQIDHHPSMTQFHYDTQQVTWFTGAYKSRSFNDQHPAPVLKNIQQHKVDLADTGRACCGGRTLCQDQNYRSRTAFVVNKFPDWYCSVNHFFLYVKQVNGEIYTNKDCKMNFDSLVAPIGFLSKTQQLLDQTKHTLHANTMPVIQCKKQRCYCGLCAPKAQDLDTYRTIMQKYEIPNPNLL